MKIFKLICTSIIMFSYGTTYSQDNIDYNKLSGLVFTSTDTNSTERLKNVIEHLGIQEKAKELIAIDDETNLESNGTNQDKGFLGTYSAGDYNIIVHKYDEYEMEATILGDYIILKKSGTNQFKNKKNILEFFLDESKVNVLLVDVSPSILSFYKQNLNQEPIIENSSQSIAPPPSPDVIEVASPDNKAETATVKKTYYDNGQLKEEISKIGKSWIGPYKKWDEQGNLIKKVIYNERGSGKVENYYTNGKLLSKGNTYWDTYKKEDIPTGLWYIYYQNGQLKEENEQKSGKIIKLVNRFLENGKQTIKNGTGYRVDLYENGQEKYNLTIINGVRNGLATWYFKNGNIQQQVLFSPGGNNYTGLRMEIIQVNNVNGKPLDKGTLKNGNGTWKVYDENGKLTKVSTYKDGIIVK